jgi:RNA polymerase sigma-70 factor (ECF subfamily)
MGSIPPDAPDATAQTEAYLRLLTEHDRWLATYVYSLVSSAADAEDILQEVKVTMWKQFSKFQAGTNFRAWARTIATHQILNYRRSSKRRTHSEIDEAFIEAVAAEIDRRAEQLDGRADALRACLHKLPEAHRKIVVWRYYEDCGVEEIAAKSARSVEAVYRLLSRIRTVLNECVSRQLATRRLS